jgi:hypothetical protein
VWPGRPRLCPRRQNVRHAMPNVLVGRALVRHGAMGAAQSEKHPDGGRARVGRPVLVVLDSQGLPARRCPSPVPSARPTVRAPDRAAPAAPAQAHLGSVVRSGRRPALRDVRGRVVRDARVPGWRARAAGRLSGSAMAAAAAPRGPAGRGSAAGQEPAARGSVCPRRPESKRRSGRSRRGLWPPAGADGDGRTGDAHSWRSPLADLSISSRMLRFPAHAQAPRRVSKRSRTSHPNRRTRRSSARWAACRRWPAACRHRVCA